MRALRYAADLELKRVVRLADVHTTASACRQLLGRRRNILLGLDRAGVVAAAEELLAPAMANPNTAEAATAIFGDASAWREQASATADWHVEEPLETE